MSKSQLGWWLFPIYYGKYNMFENQQPVYDVQYVFDINV